MTKTSNQNYSANVEDKSSVNYVIIDDFSPYIKKVEAYEVVINARGALCGTYEEAVQKGREIVDEMNALLANKKIQDN